MYSKNRFSTERINPKMTSWWVTYTGLSVMLVLMISLIIYPAASPAASTQLSAEPLLILPTVRPDDPGETTRNYHLGTGMVRFLAPSHPGSALEQPAPLDPSAPAEAAARHFLNVYGKWFGVLDPQRELKLLRTQESLDRGRSSVRFQQAYQGIPIFAGEMIVNLDAAKNVTSVNGKILPNIVLDPTPQLDASMAQATALQAVAKWYQMPEYELEVSPAVLWIYNPILLTQSKGFTALAWRMEVKAHGLTPIRELVLVNAQNGNIVLHFNQIDSAKNLKTYTMNGSDNYADLPGSLVCTYPNDLICAAGDSDAKAAHGYASDTYDFYLNTHGRDSIDGAGMMLISSVHYGVGYQNAFWDGQQMVYGDGFSAADDVVGHELTHGVTEHESNLIYYYQSGAINESFSDVWGEFMDLTNGKGTDTPAVRWLMGEDVPVIGAIRSMSNPPQFGDPDKITSTNYFLGDWDNGGVHINSGVNNKAAYLMTDGASFNGFTVTGLGIQKVAKIYYEAQTNLLTSSADYADLYDALQQACSNLVGTAGITSDNCTQVKNALDAVEMNQDPVVGLDAPLCPSGQQVAVQPLFDNMEAGSGNWTTSTLSGTSNPWYLTSDYAASGTSAVRVKDIGSVSDSVLTMANSVTVPAGAYLHFRHVFGFESDNDAYWDGGVVEYSTNNGSTWTDLSALFVDGQAYGGSLSADFSNPLGGRSAFVADSHGYDVSSRYNLASLAGQNLRIRFRQGTDSIISGPIGWVVDDVRIYNCTSSTYSLTVAKAGTGSGTVTSNPAGINCGADCSENYPANTAVTLTATPAGGSTFGGWSGACAGTGACQVTMNATKSVTATFNPVSQTPAQDTIGLYSPTSGTFYLRNSNSAGAANVSFRYGPANAGWVPLTGDWDGNGTDTIGLYSPTSGTFYLRNSNSAGAANVSFRYGPANAGWIPLTGDWDGSGS
ncbi:MAG: M4 family metallopeptidase [Gammaproteobacteria bacterium]|nr:M4 family metallopeptidase [Gammaproteobacteria bacterium]